MVLAYDTWVRSFGEDPSIVGSIARLNGVPYRIVGVAPDGFRLPGVEADLWRSIQWDPADMAATSFRRAHYVRPIARLRSGVTIEEAAARLDAVAVSLEAEYPETNRLMGAGLTPLHEFLVGDVSATLKFLLGAVALLLLLASANVGNLLLVRALARQRELAVRAALGAGRRRLVRQILVESLILSGLGGAFGVLVGWVSLRLYGTFGTSRLVDEVHLALDFRFLGYLFAILLMGGLVFSLAPLILSGRVSVADALREGGQRASAGQGTRRISGALVAGEVAIAVLLLAGAILLSRSFSALQRVEPGFQSSGVFTGGLAPPASTYQSGEEIVAFFDEVIREVEALPGVERAAVVRQLPLTSASWTSDFSIAGRAPDEYGVEVIHREISPGYFEVMRVPLLRGRTFTPFDRSSDDQVGTERVIVINEVLARQYFPDEDPIGARIAFTRTPTDDAVWWTVVGVVGTELQASPADGARIEIFAPVAQAPTRGMKLVVRTNGSPASFGRPITSLLRNIDPEIVLADPATMEEVRQAATARERFMTLMVAAFATLALTLALVGVYGVIAQALRARRREMAIRVALGATRIDLLTMSIRQSLPMLTAGIVAGIAGALLTARFAASLVYGVEPRDPATLGLAASLLLAMGLTATLLSSVRVGTAPPSTVLREE